MKKTWQVLVTILVTWLLIISYNSFTQIKAQENLVINKDQYQDVFIGNNLEIKELGIISQTPNETDSFKPENSKITEEKLSKFPVVFDGETLFSYSSKITGLSSEERARVSSQRIKKFADNYSLSIDSLRVLKLEGLRVIGTDDTILVALIEADAKTANKPIDELANEYLQKLKSAITQYREERQVSRLGLGILKAIISTIIVIFVFKLIHYLSPKIHSLIIYWRRYLFHSIRIQNFQIISAEQQEALLFKFLKILRWAVILIILYFYIPLVLGFFPWTERLSHSIFRSFYKAIGTVWSGFIDYIPNLSIIIVTGIITYYTIRLCHPLFKALEDGSISLPGFYPDWAEPTYKLTVFLILAFAAAIIFPYLPGFDSPAFQGISILIGALVTFGGASTIANLIGGFIIIYTRGFQIGDRIKIDQYVGWVLERTILSTRIRTNANEIITIPNATMIASSIINYTATLRDIGNPLILYTSITLGYDVPWRKVHETLINAALATDRIINDPPPFVWQTSLDDFYISYQLRAYSTANTELGYIYSELHQNIQDKCNEAGIEILSPHYGAMRDGNQNTIPEDYLPKDYTAPGFRLDPLKKLFNDK